MQHPSVASRRKAEKYDTSLLEKKSEVLPRTPCIAQGTQHGAPKLALGDQDGEALQYAAPELRADKEVDAF